MDLIYMTSILHGQTVTAVLTDSLSRILTRYSRYKQTKSSNEAGPCSSPCIDTKSLDLDRLPYLWFTY
jgi:hypothetical protein